MTPPWSDRLETSDRPMTARERAELSSLVSFSTAAVRAALFLAATAAVAWLLRLAQRLVAQLTGAAIGSPLWLLPTILFAAVLYRAAARWTGGRELRARIRRDLERGTVALYRIRAIEAVEAPEVEDEGPVFFIREAGGATLFFGGQYVARLKARGFPWQDFEVCEAPESRRFFRLRPLGPPLDQVGLREPLSFAESKALGLLANDFGVVNMSFEKLKAAPAPDRPPDEVG